MVRQVADMTGEQASTQSEGQQLGSSAVRQPSLRHSSSGMQSQIASRRTTTDSVLDRLVQQVHTEAEERRLPADDPSLQPMRQQLGPEGSVSIFPQTATPSGSAAADTVGHSTNGQAEDWSQQQPQLQSVPSAARPARQRPTADSLEHSTTEQAENWSQHQAQAQSMPNTVGPARQRPTADSVLSDILDDVEEAEQASVDTLLDGVLNEVAGAASRQRTTADSVLDAMLNDLAISQPMQAQANAVSFLRVLQIVNSRLWGGVQREGLHNCNQQTNSIARTLHYFGQHSPEAA